MSASNDDVGHAGHAGHAGDAGDAAGVGGVGGTDPESSDPRVVDDIQDRRFEIVEQGERASLAYMVHDGAIYLIHTEVPPPLEGRGYGSRLVRAALAYAMREHLRVVPRCPFARAYLRRHPEYAALVEGA